MPPCWNVLLNKVERTKYLSKIIKSATENSIEEPEKGWTVNENQFMEINYFDGDPFPDHIADEISSESEDDDDDENYYSENESDVSDECSESDDEWQSQ